MKKLYFLFFITIGFLGNAQIVNIPDANFKAKLLSSSPSNNIASTEYFNEFENVSSYVSIDTNGNGEIEQSEAALIVYLNIAGTISTDLTGIEFFTNLKYLSCNNSLISSLNVSQNLNLEKLHCHYSQLAFLDVSQNLNLKLLSCSNNQISSLNVNQNINLEYLNCDNNYLTILDVTQNINLKVLNCDYNQLTSLNVTSNSNLETLFCRGLLLNTLDVSNNSYLSTLYCYGSQLSRLNIKNNNLYWDALFFDGNPNLQYICADDEDLNDVQFKINQFFYTNCHVNSYCSFTPGGTYYDISGNTKFDSNNNGCDISDIIYSNLNFSITDGTNTSSFTANQSGSYFMPVQEGTHTVTPNLENPTYFTISPTSFTVDFPTQMSPLTQDFCVSANGNHSDVEIVLIPTTPARPGFDSNYKVIYRNKGNQVENGSIIFSIQNQEVVDFVSSLPIFNFQTLTPTAEKFTWNYSNLQPFETREIEIILNLNSPMETPALNAGDLLSFDAQIIITNSDENIFDNYFAIRQEVVNSFDPNDKICLQGESIAPSDVGKYVHYVIRFENTGTFAAENIVVKDLIDMDKFDIATLVPLNSSHDFHTRIDGNKVEFIFENINLDFDDASNDGYVVFKIKTKPALVVGNTFSNSVNIYFDYNFPITTNTYTTTVESLNNQNFDFGTYFILYPNPAKDVLKIQTKQDIGINSIEIYNQLGQIVMAVPNAVNAVDVSNLVSGTYFLKINTEKGKATTKFLKE